MSEKVTSAIKFLEKNNLIGLQIFNTRNIVGDPIVNIYKRDNVIIDYCAHYGYLEIFGLNDKEWEEFMMFYFAL